jgi:hypothetical protein
VRHAARVRARYASVMPVAPLLARFLGTWRGSGSGSFPTMEPFDFEEEIRFLDVGSRDLAYLQRAWRANTDEVLHAEAGMWRATDEGQLTAMIAQPRTAEVSEGTIVDGAVTLQSISIGKSEPPSKLAAVGRTYRIEGDELVWEMQMATQAVPELTHHLTGRLRRVPD